MKKIFYDHGKWLAFEAPEKPRQMSLYMYPPGPSPVWDMYLKALALAKENALEVGNAEILKSVGYLDLKHDGGCFEWKGSAVIKDGKYILSI